MIYISHVLHKIDKPYLKHQVTFRIFIYNVKFVFQPAKSTFFYKVEECFKNISTLVCVFRVIATVTIVLRGQIMILTERVDMLQDRLLELLPFNLLSHRHISHPSVKPIGHPNVKVMGHPINLM